MREAAFREQNKKRWQHFEQLLSQPRNVDADQLADLFVQLTDDLAYSATQYPESPTTLYLNQLTGKVHQLIYRNKKEKKSRLITFWTQELPLIFYSMRLYFLYSLILFLITAAIGAFSAAYDDTFVRLILGDSYVNQTLYNIKNGDPMAVYKQQDAFEMFFLIALNNIKVSFQVFAMGVMLPLIGACVMLFYNGVMLGSFQYFFHTKGLLLFSAMTIWLHGTIEIAAIVLAGGAGWRVGNSILFPETYSRADSFRLGAKEGVKVLFGLIPFFLVAAFIEGFVTRHTEMPTVVKLLIIGGSLAFLVWYVILYPRKVAQNA
ncbi:Uncharacterized membrane protein SpoIIM, required for sporulation [Flexibacter flexilis DSM 6793]|uniref:Uncharacterized membrane protein SpoIIM, required for sporulation n=1 Tax=Flexibacter flexilis DSM 6793 TaxID=927664 RepID=A0A1I1NW68_9BACT|nr:stage II sporulation protein M [Flexibacter flexilis]SFD01849.1 Uncharacterized membrane protein SpoIIM, required for sporulation [Flexibacter flexilis DSM 6793]